MPKDARCASLLHCWGSSGASVATMTITDPPRPAGGSSAVRPYMCPASSGMGTSATLNSGPMARPLMRSRSRFPWLASTRTPTVYSVAPNATCRDDVPVPPLNPWQTIPVPPPTFPSATGPAARPSAATTCSARTCCPSTSLSSPSQVSPTTGMAHSGEAPARSAIAAPTRASLTVPTDQVLVSAIGPFSIPHSATSVRPVSSPTPETRWNPANLGRSQGSGPGRMTVTPVRTGPWPRTSGPDPLMMVSYPTRTPATSVMALHRPGRYRPIARPKSRSRRCAGPGSATGCHLSFRAVTLRPAPGPRPRAEAR